jgi:uncharacterized membrane protein YfcA
MPEDSLLIGIIAVIAGAIAAVSGFGIGSLLTPVLMRSMPTGHGVPALGRIPEATYRRIIGGLLLALGGSLLAAAW